MPVTNNNPVLLAGGTLERLASGFVFTEGPVWISAQRCLLFSDIPANKIYRYQSGKVDVFREPTGHSNGLALDRRERLILCEQGGRRVVRVEADGSISVLADRYNGKRLNSPNDLVVRSDGAIYFTDPPYGIQRDVQEQPFQGVYLLTEDLRPRLIADDFELPNGLAFSPDERRLLINDSARNHIRVFDVLPDGRLANGGLFAEMKERTQGVADGMKINQRGDVFCAGPGGIWVFDANGNQKEILSLPELPSNCAFGDDWLTLFITAKTSIYALQFNENLFTEEKQR